MERRAQPNGTIMASKRVEIGPVSEAPPILPVAKYFVPIFLIAFWAPDETRLSSFC